LPWIFFRYCGLQFTALLIRLLVLAMPDQLQLLQRVAVLEMQAALDAQNLAQLRERNNHLVDPSNMERARGEQHAEVLMHVVRTCDSRVEEIKTQHAAVIMAHQTGIAKFADAAAAKDFLQEGAKRGVEGSCASEIASSGREGQRHSRRSESGKRSAEAPTINVPSASDDETDRHPHRCRCLSHVAAATVALFVCRFRLEFILSAAVQQEG
jgi:hypothetical protein